LEGYEEVFGININEEDVDKMFAEIDMDGNGTIDYTEYLMATMNDKAILTNEKLQ
jgi:calcium-dependent protein kinase